MITSIQGTLTSATPLHAIIELNGIGYETHVPVTTAEKLPPPGASVKLHTLVIYREDAQTLYGFTTPQERDFFRLMIEHVTGIGPKMALSVLSGMSVSDFKDNVIRCDACLGDNVVVQVEVDQPNLGLPVVLRLLTG